MQGILSKLRSQHDSPVQYELVLDDATLPLNNFIDQTVEFTYTGKIVCTHCGRQTKKSYSQGHCFPCARKLASCDICIMRPELCHYHEGTCREPDWGQAHCVKPHWVYLANASGLKVGITRKTNVPFRWIDQGAIQALPILEVSTRYQSGLIETRLSQHVSDKTNWRVMLRDDVVEMDLQEHKAALLAIIQDEIETIKDRFGDDSIAVLNEAMTQVQYPIEAYPSKIVSINLEKTPKVRAKLLGIKGQYCLFDVGVMNIRKYTGYEMVFSS